MVSKGDLTQGKGNPCQPSPGIVGGQLSLRLATSEEERTNRKKENRKEKIRNEKIQKEKNAIDQPQNQALL